MLARFYNPSSIFEARIKLPERGWWTRIARSLRLATTAAAKERHCCRAGPSVDKWWGVCCARSVTPPAQQLRRTAAPAPQPRCIVHTRRRARVGRHGGSQCAAVREGINEVAGATESFERRRESCDHHVQQFGAGAACHTAAGAHQVDRHAPDDGALES